MTHTVKTGAYKTHLKKVVTQVPLTLALRMLPILVPRHQSVPRFVGTGLSAAQIVMGISRSARRGRRASSKSSRAPLHFTVGVGHRNRGLPAVNQAARSGATGIGTRMRTPG